MRLSIRRSKGNSGLDRTNRHIDMSGWKAVWLQHLRWWKRSYEPLERVYESLLKLVVWAHSQRISWQQRTPNFVLHQWLSFKKKCTNIPCPRTSRWTPELDDGVIYTTRVIQNMIGRMLLHDWASKHTRFHTNPFPACWGSWAPWVDACFLSGLIIVVEIFVPSQSALLMACECFLPKQGRKEGGRSIINAILVPHFNARICLISSQESQSDQKPPSTSHIPLFYHSLSL